jgi:DNA repair protein RadC
MRVAEVTIKYDQIVKNSEREQVSSSQKSYEILRPFYEDLIDYKEFSYMILLNRSNRVLGVHKLSEGGMCGTIVDLKIVFQVALLAGASAIILSHNHPSGNLSASEQDKILTKKITEAGKLLEILVLDHLILTSEGYYSFADNGQI